MPLSHRIFPLLLATVLVGVTTSTRTAMWLVVTDQARSALDVDSLVSRAQGIVTRSIPAIGVFTVRGDAQLARRLEAYGMRAVRIGDADVQAADHSFTARPRNREMFHKPHALFARHPVILPLIDDDFYSAGQWGLEAIAARAAWAAGARGRGVRIAVLDTGVDPTHPDLTANVNTSLAVSFVDGQTWNVSTDAVQDFDHGTHIAGIIAAADNAFGVIGVAPEAEIVPVQVLRRPTGNGRPDDVIAGMVYAADIGADVINLSLAFTRHRSGGIVDFGTPDPTDDFTYTAAEAAALNVAFARAAEYAHARGATIVTGTHNNATDANRDRDLFLLPRDSPHVIAVAATGPLRWALDPRTDLDVPASFSNYGQSVVDVAAPGGNIDVDLLASNQLCTVQSAATAVTLPCWFFDGVLSTAPVAGGYLFEFRRGTSMASAHASGVAALIIGRYRNALSPPGVRSRLLSTADDLGKAGKDAFYGMGRVNALAAVD